MVGGELGDKGLWRGEALGCGRAVIQCGSSRLTSPSVRFFLNLFLVVRHYLFSSNSVIQKSPHFAQVIKTFLYRGSLC